MLFRSVDVQMVARLWTNGIAQNYVEGEARSMASSVFVLGDNVYVAGYVDALQKVEPGSGITPVTYFKASLWKNGKRLRLDVGNYEDSRALSVFVK